MEICRSPRVYHSHVTTSQLLDPPVSATCTTQVGQWTYSNRHRHSSTMYPVVSSKWSDLHLEKAEFPAIIFPEDGHRVKSVECPWRGI